MSRYSCRLVIMAFTVITLTGCSEEEIAPAPEVVRPVKTMLIAAPADAGIRQFAGRIDANRKAELAFRVPGTVQKITVKEGDAVNKDQIIARLDPTDYQITVNDRQASFDAALANYERGKVLVKKGSISKMDFDKLEERYKNTRAALERARQDLSYTSLRAPFAGIIAVRHVENFEEVQAKQSIMTLNDTSVLEVKVNVPETIMLQIQADRAQSDEERLDVYASFDTLLGEKFKLTFKEMATKADPKTQTFEATFTMSKPEGLTILPGMTVTVTSDLSKRIGIKTVYLLPVSAVVADTGLQPTAWIVDENSMTLTPRKIAVGKMLGRSIEVTEGLNPGDRVVTAGVPFLVDGMKVTLLPKTEQADPATAPSVE